MGVVEKSTEQKRLMFCRATPGKLTGTAALISLPDSRLRILISVEKKNGRFLYLFLITCLLLPRNRAH